MASSRSHRAAARPSRAPTVTAVAVVLLLVVVVGGFLYVRSTATPDTPTAAPVTATYATSVDAGVVVAGAGPTVVDVYEDALCPACRQFETVYGDRITTALNAGRIQVRYHLVNLLDEQSRPAGYSTLGGNALICAAENGAFPGVHEALYAQQPAEGGAGFSADQLAALGAQAGAAPAYADCVRSGRYAAAVTQNYERAVADRGLFQTVGGQTGFGTPTVRVQGRTVAVTSPEFQSAIA